MLKRAFTLVEMLVVIVVISLMIWLVMFSWWKNVTEIQFRSDKETFLSTFTKIRTNALSSNYYKDVKYESLEMEYDSNKNKIKISYVSWWTNYDLENIYFTNSFFSWSSWFRISLYPYSLNCNLLYLDPNINNNWMSIVQLRSKNKKYSYCFNMESSSCRLKEIQCLENK